MAEKLSFTVKESSSDPKPRSTTTRAKTVATKQQVDKAVNVMNNLYRAVGVGLVFTGYPESAGALAEEKDRLEVANREAFESNVKLAEFIGNAGEVSAFASFFIAHGVAVFSVVGTARKEKQTKNVSRETSRHVKNTEPDITPTRESTTGGTSEPTHSNVAGILFPVS